MLHNQCATRLHNTGSSCVQHSKSLFPARPRLKPRIARRLTQLFTKNSEAVQSAHAEENKKAQNSEVAQPDLISGVTSKIEGVNVSTTSDPTSSSSAKIKDDVQQATTRRDILDAGSREVTSHAVELDKDDIFGTKELVSELQDQQLFGKRGEAWFFAQVAVFLLVVFPPIPLRGLVDMVGTLAVTAGVVFMIYGLFSLGRNFSPLPQPRRRHLLVTKGMYSYVRHPIYAGLLLVCFGWAAISGCEGRLALSCLLWWVLEKKVSAEESALKERYQEYQEYQKKVPKFFPYVY